MNRWIKDELPQTAGYYLVVAHELIPYTDEFMNDQFKDKIKIIFYFKERNVTGWEKDWTGESTIVRYWMPLPKIPSI